MAKIGAVLIIVMALWSWPISAQLVSQFLNILERSWFPKVPLHNLTDTQEKWCKKYWRNVLHMLPLQVILYSMKTIKINIDSVESYLLAIVFISNSIQPTMGRGSVGRGLLSTSEPQIYLGLMVRIESVADKMIQYAPVQWWCEEIFHTPTLTAGKELYPLPFL